MKATTNLRDNWDLLSRYNYNYTVSRDHPRQPDKNWVGIIFQIVYFCQLLREPLKNVLADFVR